MARLFPLTKYHFAIKIKLSTKFSGQVFDAGRSSVLNDVLDGEGRGSRVESRGRGNYLIPHAGDAQPQPIELPEGRCNDAKFRIQQKLRKNCLQNNGQQNYRGEGAKPIRNVG